MGAIDQDRVISAHFSRQPQGGLGWVDDDDLGGCHRLQALDPDMTEAAGTDHDCSRPGAQHRDCLLDRMDRGQPSVGQGGDLLGIKRWVELHDRPRGRLQEVGEPTIAVDPRKGAIQAVHVVAGPARTA